MTPLRDAAESATAGVPVVDYERIWLEPKCADDNPKYDEGRTWCQHDVYETCPDCGTKATEYVRADLHVSALSELDTAMAEIDRLGMELAVANRALTAAQARIAELEGKAVTLITLLDDFMVVSSLTANDRYAEAVDALRATLSPAVKEPK